MGKGTIISGGTDGQYQVSVVYNTDRAQAEKAANLAKIANLESQIASETDDRRLNVLILQKLSVEKRNAAIDSIPESETISAWCADLTEDITGDVGLIEVPGESVDFNIQPGHEDNAAYDADRDGQLTPTMAMSSAAAFYNLAMLPGWQKWKPTFRYGAISEITGETCTVTLDVAISTQQGLGVNQSSVLYNVPIEYMDCDGVAFQDGDEVLIKFIGQDWSSPKVVGFKEHPKPCGEDNFFFVRITNPGDLVSDLRMDRIILWDISRTVGDKSTIIPGQGSIFLDVDVINDIVYYADPSFADDAAAIAKANEYLSSEAEDMADAWFKTGPVSDPKYNYVMCHGYDGTDPDASEQTIDMSEYFTGGGDPGEFYHMIERIEPDESGTIDPDELDVWRSIWCIDEGGDPSADYDGNIWPKLTVNASNYPETICPPNGAYAEQQACYEITTHPDYGVISMYAQHCSQPGATRYRSIADGVYFTAKGIDKAFPSFFVYQDMSGMGFSNNGDAGYIEDGILYIFGYHLFEYSFSNRYGLTSGSAVVTPLERIPCEEVCLMSGRLDMGSVCEPAEDMDCLPGHENMQIILKGDNSICNEAQMIPCTKLCNDEGDRTFGQIKKETTMIDNIFQTSVKILNPNNVDCNLMSLSVFIDRSVGVQSAWSYNWWGDEWRCSGEYLGDDFDTDVPFVCSNELGVVFYIMNPSEYWWENPTTGEVEFWDIHSLREASPDEINSYRVLDLEDHVNGILIDLRTGIRNYPTTLPVYPGTDDGFYSLQTYGYGIYNGFVTK